jgi:PAS domain S-box-containing protein
MSSTAFAQRSSGISTPAELAWGTHFGVFYSTEREFFDIVVPCLRAGLEHDEFCWLEVPDGITARQAMTELSLAVPDLGAHVTRGQIEIGPLPGSPDQPLSERFERLLDRAIVGGFDGLRLACRGAADTHATLAAAAAAFGRLNIIAAVAYPRAEFDALAFMQAVQDHRFALVCSAGRWEVLEGSEARTVREALERSEEKLQSLFANMSEGFAYHRIVLDANGRPCDYVFLELNAAFERLTGLEGRDVRGRRVTEVLPGIEADPADWIGRYGRVALTGEPLRFESYAEPLGKWYAVSAFSPHKGYFAASFSDITDRKTAEAELRRALECERDARREAEIANRTKDDFLASVSHELRSPLNAILGWAVMLRSGVANDAATKARALDAIERGARAQRQLIEDLLDLARITSGKLRLDVQAVDLIPVIEAAVDTVRPTADARQLRLHVVVDPNAGPVSGDPERLQQVVWNLLSNAIKFTNRGGRIEVRLERVNSQVEIVVSDSGAGIAPDLIPHVFERFRQGAGARRSGGLGLGLAIARELVELHGGTIRAGSPGVGKGSSFTVCLPLRAVQAEPAHPVATPVAAADSPSLVGIRVLAVDDEVETREVLRVMFESAGAEVCIVSSAREALDALTTGRFDVLVSDIEMPLCDGYGLIRQVRRLDALRGRHCQPSPSRRTPGRTTASAR